MCTNLQDEGKGTSRGEGTKLFGNQLLPLRRKLPTDLVAVLAAFMSILSQADNLPKNHCSLGGGEKLHI